MKTYTKAYIQSLLDKYLDGLTSLEEERLLGEYFRTQSVPPEWEDYHLGLGRDHDLRIGAFSDDEFTAPDRAADRKSVV